MSLLAFIMSDLGVSRKASIGRIFLKYYFNMSFRLALNYRVGHYLHNHRSLINNLLILWLKKRQIKNFSCDISYQCKIGYGVKFPHPVGIVIGVNSVIGNEVTIWQHVTLGSMGKFEKAYPTIENNVKLFANCQILGAVTVCENSRVGASAVVISDVPKNATAVGIPAKVI